MLSQLQLSNARVTLREKEREKKGGKVEATWCEPVTEQLFKQPVFFCFCPAAGDGGERGYSAVV